MDLRLGAFSTRLATPSSSVDRNHPVHLHAGAAKQPETAEVKKLRKAAAEFEASLISSWWSAMKDSGLSGDEDTDPGKGTLDQLGMQAISAAISSGKGLGIGEMLVRSLVSKHPEIDSGIKTGQSGAPAAQETSEKAD